MNQTKKISILSLTREMFSDRIYIHKLFSLALPSALQMMLNMLVNFLDTAMIGKLGETAIASVGLANKFYFVFILMIVGVASGSGILASQYWGKQDLKNLKKILGLGIILSLIVSILFTTLGIFIPQKIMAIFSTNPKTIQLGASYIAVVCLSYPLVAISFTYISILRAIGEVKTPLIITTIAIIVNVSLNYCLIFGKFGFPVLGIIGASIATSIARMIELILIISSIYIRKNILACKLYEMLGYSQSLITQYIQRAFPVIANEFMWGLGTTLYSVAYGRMGNTAIASITISSTLEDVVTVWLSGIASATVVILGNELGANRIHTTKKYGAYSYITSICASIFVMFLLTTLKYPFLSLYNVSDEVERNVILCITIFTCFIPFKSLAWVTIVGILRSGGDTIACLLLDISGVWIIGVPLAFLGGLYWQFPVYIVYSLVLTEEIYKSILAYLRYRQGKWLKNLTIEL